MLAPLHGDAIPRIDCHRHLGGAIPVPFVWNVIQAHGLKHLAETETDVYEAMTFMPGEVPGFHRFLDKFQLLDHIPWTEPLIAESIRLVCTDLLAEDLDYCWMRFSINKYMDAGIPWHRWQAIQFIHEVFEHYAPGRVGLLLALKYESVRASQKQLAKLIIHPIVRDSVIGIDLVGDEAYFVPEFYAPIMREWQQAGKVTCAHVGESQPAHNVRSCIQMGLTDIAHGFQIWEYPEIMQLAKDHEVVFHLALTSTYLTGCCTDPTWHPIRALADFGLQCTIGTDDPIQCGCTLDSEYQLLQQLGFTRSEIIQLARTAARRTAQLVGVASKFTME